MLYFRALQQGLAASPSADAAVRQRLDGEARELGWVVLQHRLQKVDPQAAARIHPNDQQRMQRAIEVNELTGRPLSAWLAATERTASPAAALKLVVAPDDRIFFLQRICAFFHIMFEHGFIA